MNNDIPAFGVLTTLAVLALLIYGACRFVYRLLKGK